MSLLSDEISRAFAEVGRTTAPTDPSEPSSQTYVFTWKGTEYAALAAVETKGRLFGAGGFTEDNGLTLTVELSVFTGDVPQPDQFVTYKGHRYRIDMTKPSPDGTGIVFICNDPDRGTGIVEREM